MSGSTACRRHILKNRRAASPAVSMVIITAATVVLVLISGSFALQILERQQGANEFDTVKKSLLTFDDAFRDIAFDRGGSRSVRFTTKYGYLKLIPNGESMNISVQPGVLNNPVEFANIPMGVIKYLIPTSYVTYGDGYRSYVLGNESLAVTSATDSIGRLLATQQSGFLTLDLDYRVRVTREGPSTSLIAPSGLVNYVDILVMRMNITNSLSLTGDFDLIAKNLAINTYSKVTSTLTSTTSTTCEIDFKMGNVTTPTKIYIALDPGQVVFNLIIADIKVSN